MPKRLLPLALATLLLPAAGWAQDQKPSTDKPAEAQPAQEPEKKPDAFRYFFGKKREERKKAPEAQKPAPAPVAPAPAAVEAPAPVEEVRPEPPAVAAPILAPAPVPEMPRTEEPKVDAFQYFFGHATQPLPEVMKEEGSKKPVTAFEYFFGKNGRADEPEQPQSPPEM